MQALIDFDGWRKWKEFPSVTKSVGSVGGSLTAGSSGSNSTIVQRKVGGSDEEDSA